MNETSAILTCLNCNRPETERPLVSLRYRGKPAWICTQCLPILIHHPQRLSGKLENAEQIPPGAPDGQ